MFLEKNVEVGYFGSLKNVEKLDVVLLVWGVGVLKMDKWEFIEMKNLGYEWL